MTSTTPAETRGDLPDTSTAISAVDVSKSFTVDGREVPVLHEVSLSISTHEMVAIMGSSGSGKSTLMYCLAGLERPSSGQVDLHGAPLGSMSRAALARMRRTPSASSSSPTT